jgi:hypothetical protein
MLAGAWTKGAECVLVRREKERARERAPRKKRKWQWQRYWTLRTPEETTSERTNGGGVERVHSPFREVGPLRVATKFVWKEETFCPCRFVLSIFCGHGSWPFFRFIFSAQVGAARAGEKWIATTRLLTIVPIRGVFFWQFHEVGGLEILHTRGLSQIWLQKSRNFLKSCYVLATCKKSKYGDLSLLFVEMWRI